MLRDWFSPGLALMVVLAYAGLGFGCGYVGYSLANAKWERKEHEREQITAAEKAKQQKELGTLQAEVERLKARPEKVRTVTEEVVKYVQADAACESLPPSWRVLWNVEPGSDPAAGAPGVGDEGLRSVAATER